MATLVVGSGSICRPLFMAGGGRPKVKSFPEAASQTFKAGELIILGTATDKGNEVKVASDNPTTAIVVGIAVHDATQTEGTHASGSGVQGQMGNAGSLGLGVTGGLTKGIVQVWLAGRDNLFVAHTLDTQAIDNNDIGKQFGFEKDTTNKVWRVDNTDTSNKSVQIVDLFDNDADVNGRYVFKFLGAVNVLYGDR